MRRPHLWIHAADVTVFFLDEDQRVTLADIGTRDEIVLWAEELGADVEELELRSQFRCNGSDGYRAWVDHVLGIRETHARRLLLALEEQEGPRGVERRHPRARLPHALEPRSRGPRPGVLFEHCRAPTR